MKSCAKVFAVGSLIAVFCVPTSSLALSPPAPTDAQIIAGLQAQIAALLAQVQQLQAQLAAVQDQTQMFCYNWTRNLRIGDSGSGADVKALVRALMKERIISQENILIPGNDYIFTESVASAVVGFQEKYRSEVLTPNGLARGTGYVGPATRRVLNRLYGCAQTNNPSIIVVSPNGGETWQIGNMQTIKYSYVNAGLTVDAYLVDSSGSESLLAYGFYLGQEISLKLGFASPIIPGTYKIRLKTKSGSGVSVVSDTSDNYFTISSATTTPSITVLSPNGGESWQKGNTQIIRWSNANISTPVNLYLLKYPLPPVCTDPACSPALPYTIAKDLRGVDQFFWKVGDITTYAPITVPNGQYTVQVCMESSQCDSSDAPFTITSTSTY